MDFKASATALFETHPTVDAFNFTSDGFAFARHSDAEGHAQSLPSAERAIKTVTRAELSDAPEGTKVDEPKVDEPKVDEPKADEPKVGASAAPKVATKKAAVKK